MSFAYWCHQCNAMIRLDGGQEMVCPTCNGGFVEEMERGERESRRQLSHAHHLLGCISNLLGHLEGRRRPGRGRLSFTPMLILRRNPNPSGAEGESASIEVYFDSGSGVGGLRRLPPHLTEYFMGFGLDRLIEHLSNSDPGVACGALPASRSAVDAMPAFQIAENHLGHDLHCAVCKDAYEIGEQALEMPCKHIYHSDCILPWLSQHNSCPVCRHAMPTEDQTQTPSPSPSSSSAGTGEIGLTIWRLPGGGFAVGRFSGESLINFNNNNTEGVREASTDNRRESGPSDGENQGRRRNPFSFLWPFRSSSSNTESQNTPSSSNDQNSRRRAGWPFEDGIGPSRWFS
ncbi:hypothetical protein SUGI_0402160 [Cryptomeria japonica]|uniref:E3 ubiquitin-protein ligase RDUF2 n=1 Tax=Cryptomeria japonica TaxID=3369 RepID=UPI002408D90C|nr:E3 ubiquitin-protein ligase RDUF2 [Cryptomeria japonica]GLJ21620.1 hypothetical protein SUGI_0402160 [Cryptomeria japonica]